MLVKFYYRIIALHICLRLCCDWLKGLSKNRETDTAASKRKGKKKQQTVEDKWRNVQTVVSSSILSLHTLTFVLNFSSSAIFPLFTCHCDSFYLCWTGLLLHMTKGKCCRGPELNRIPFTLKEFQRQDISFLILLRLEELLCSPYVAIYTSAFLNVNCPF